VRTIKQKKKTATAFNNMQLAQSVNIIVVINKINIDIITFYLSFI